MRLDHRSILPAIGVAFAGLASMVFGRFLWMYDDEPMVDLGGDE